jgi:uroporphyrinogen decarboxylase
MATVTDPEGAQRLIDFCAGFIWRLTERIIDHPLVPGFNLSEPVASPDMISPLSFKRFVKPALAELVNRARTMGKYSMIHICGDSTGLLEEVAEVGPTAFSLESKVDLAQAKRVLGGKVCVAGNVSPTGSFLSGTPEEVINEAKACLAAWGEDGGGYILTVGCDFPKEVPLKNALALMSLKEEE